MEYPCCVLCNASLHFSKPMREGSVDACPTGTGGHLLAFNKNKQRSVPDRSPGSPASRTSQHARQSLPALCRKAVFSRTYTSTCCCKAKTPLYSYLSPLISCLLAMEQVWHVFGHLCLAWPLLTRSCKQSVSIRKSVCLSRFAWYTVGSSNPAVRSSYYTEL